ncbi:MAG: phosphoribosylamine--glycine ligase [bacterium]
MKVLLYGSGAREHAIAWKLISSPLLTELYLYKPNDGFAHLGKIINASNNAELAIKALEEKIELLIVGPEDPLVNGVVDEFKKLGIPAIGPDKKWAMLEGSKSFAKDFMFRNNLPTANYIVVSQKKEIEKALDNFDLPVVLKADGLAAGKGVFIVYEKAEAVEIIEEFLEGKFGEASKNVVIEEFLEGEELSLISLWDGKTLLPLVPARDYKRLLDNNNGPNTGGMGSYCPVLLTSEQQKELDIYTKMLENSLREEKADFSGIIYSGLMMTNKGLKVLEYNMRFGDPETQAILPYMESDLLYLFNKAVNKELDKIQISWKKGLSLCLVIAAKGYPFDPIKGGEIKNIDLIQEKFGVSVFFAGVKKQEEKFFANGGRVLSICKTGIEPQKDIYAAAKELCFDDKYYRTDIQSNSILTHDVIARSETK